MIDIIVTLLQLLGFAIVIRSLISWVDPTGRNQISQLLDIVVEPIVSPIRNLMGGRGGVGGMDFSPLIATILIFGLARALAAA